MLELNTFRLKWRNKKLGRESIILSNAQNTVCFLRQISEMLKLLRPEVMTLLLSHNFTESSQVKYHGARHKRECSTAGEVLGRGEILGRGEVTLLVVIKADYESVQLNKCIAPLKKVF